MVYLSDGGWKSSLNGRQTAINYRLESWSPESLSRERYISPASTQWEALQIPDPMLTLDVTVGPHFIDYQWTIVSLGTRAFNPQHNMALFNSPHPALHQAWLQGARLS